jgi:hypothetical protein
MPHFILKIDLTGHIHAHAPSAHRQTVAALLAQAAQSFSSTQGTEGELVQAAPNQPTKVLGSWKFVDE